MPTVLVFFSYSDGISSTHFLFRGSRKHNFFILNIHLFVFVAFQSINNNLLKFILLLVVQYVIISNGGTHKLVVVHKTLIYTTMDKHDKYQSSVYNDKLERLFS